MEAAARGAARAGGLVVGILPGPDRRAANPYVSLAIATDLGEARNAVLVRAADACVAIGGGWGTLSEIALARRMGRPVVGLRTWRPQPPPGGGGEPGPADQGFLEAADPEEAANVALALAGAAVTTEKAAFAEAAPLAGHATLRARFTGRPGEIGTWVVTAHPGGLQVEHPDLAQALRLAAATAGSVIEVSIGRRLAMKPGVAAGRVHLRGTELPVAAVLEAMAETLSTAGVREHYPILADEDVAACLRFAADAISCLRLSP